MNIAICDDETVFIRQLHRKISEMKIPDCHIHEFTSGRDLLNNTVAGKFEICPFVNDVRPRKIKKRKILLK